MKWLKRTVLAPSFLLCLASLGYASTSTLLSVEPTSPPTTNYVSFFPSISDDGSWVAFSSFNQLLTDDQNSQYDIYARNIDTGELVLVSKSANDSTANSFSMYPRVSSDGRYVAFYSYSSDLVSSDWNYTGDVFVRDLVSGKTEIVSVATDGTQGIYDSNGASISADGRYIAFHTVSKLSPDDNTGVIGVYVRDREAQTTQYVGLGSNPSLSGDGNFITYRSYDNLVLQNLHTGELEVIATGAYDKRLQTNQKAYVPSVSGDGRFVAYAGWSAEGAPLSTEVFLYDRLNKTTRQVTRAYDGGPLTSNSDVYYSPLKPKISTDGRFIVFFSCAADLVEGGYGRQLYIYDVENDVTKSLEIERFGDGQYNTQFDINGDGSVIVFQDYIRNHILESDLSGTGVFALKSEEDSPSDIPEVPPITSEDDSPSDVPEIPPVTLEEPSISASPSVLWPPNSKMNEVNISVDSPGAESVEIEIIDEYGTFSQTAYGNNLSIKLEAWRKGNDKDGRIYKINVKAISASGETKSTTTSVVVPHDKH